VNTDVINVEITHYNGNTLAEEGCSRCVCKPALRLLKSAICIHEELKKR
jgi:hypothetical protein